MRPSARLCPRLSLAAAILIGAAGAPALAQYYPGERGYDAPPRGYDDGYRGRVYRAAPPPVRQVGLNCDAVQPGVTGPHPYSCPLPGPRPLGARCFCNTPIAPLSGGDTVAGYVVP